VSRFTLDSATEFLFGKTVASLSAGIPYSQSSGKENPSSFTEHASNTFVTAFQEGQIIGIDRMGFGSEWPLAEFWKDKIAPLRKVMDDFTGPVLAAALEKREQERKKEKDVANDEDLTLLAHLVKHTQGKCQFFAMFDQRSTPCLNIRSQNTERRGNPLP
jgi:hypothetical protein